MPKRGDVMKMDLEFLAENRIFSGLLNPQEGQNVYSLFKTGSAKRKDLFYRPGDPADTVYWIKSGRVKISKLTEDGREIILGMYKPGDVFGEMAFVEDAPRNTFAEAADDVTFLAIKRNHLFALAKRKPGVIFRLAQLIGERRREAEEVTEALLYKGVRERLAGVLLKLSKEYGIDDARGKLLRIKITHQDLASLIGSSRETVSLTLGDMKRDGLIDINERKIIIKDLEQLESLS